MAKHLLNDQKIRAWLKGTANTALHDGGGLYLRKRAGGAYWSLRQVNPHTGKRTWAGLLENHAYPSASLHDARKAADAGRALALENTDLVRHKAAKISAAKEAQAAAALEQQRRQTVKQVFEAWTQSELKPHIGGDGKRIGRVDGGRYVREQFQRRVFPYIGAAAIQDVRKADVLGLLDKVKDEGKLRTANTLLADLKQFFRFAAEREFIEHSPIELVQKRKVGGKDVKRDRFLSVQEIAQLKQILSSASLDKRTELGIWVIIATGCRIGELMGAAWIDAQSRAPELQKWIDSTYAERPSEGPKLGFVDLVGRTWHMPSTKNQRDHTIHISDFAASLFQALLDIRKVNKVTGEKSPWLFPATKGTGAVGVKTFGKQLADRQTTREKRLKNRTKAYDALALPGGRWTAHDLRRTASTLMAQLGVSRDVIDECQNHIIQGMGSVYIHDRRLEEQKRAFELLGKKLSEI